MPDNTPWTDGKIWSVIAAAGIPLAVSMMLGRMFRPDAWYWCLKRSCLSPPGWVFGLVWFALYILLGVSMVAACYETDRGWTWILPIINITVTFLFAPVMFGLYSTVGGAVITALCLAFGIAIIVQYATINHSALASWMMAPYVAWLLLATYLAVYVWKSNDCQTLTNCQKKVRKSRC